MRGPTVVIAHGPFPDEAWDAVVDGEVPELLADSPLIPYLAELQVQTATTAPPPGNRLSSVFEHGLAEPGPADEGILTFASEREAGILAASAADDILVRGILTTPTDRGILTRRSRGRLLARVMVTKFAAFGLLSKAAVAGATVTVAATGAGAAGVLPTPAQVVFDDAVGREVAAAEDHEPDAEGATRSDDTPPGTEADAGGVDGRAVSDDATGADGSAPGVDGRDVAEEASDGRADGAAAEDRPASTGQDRALEVPASPGAADREQGTERSDDRAGGGPPPAPRD